VKPIEAKTKTDRTMELVRGMNQAGKEYVFAVKNYGAICLASMDMMLAAGDVFWGDDFFKMLQQEKEILERDFNDSTDEDNRHTLACMRLSDVVSDWPVEQIDELINRLQDGIAESILQPQVA